MRRFAALLAVAMCLPAAISTSGAAAAGCPNEAVRVGPSALLPGCRAYEMVSPLEKNGGNVSVTLGVHAAPEGGAVAFGSTASFAGSLASPLGGAYISRRGANWATESVDPPQFNHHGLLIRATPASSPDLDFSFGASRLALTPGAQEGGSNLYLRDNATGARTLLAATPGEELFIQANDAGGGAYIAGSRDWSHILINTSEAIPVTSGPEPAAGVQNLYDLTRGTVRVVNVLPKNEEGNEIVDGSGAHIGTSNRPYLHAISEDGSRIFFQLGGNGGTGPLYLRENDATTTPISVSQNGAETGEVKEVEFGGATPDGSLVFFNGQSELLEGAGSGGLYRYDVASGELTALIANPPVGGARVSLVLGVSHDGSYVYFSSPAVLAEGATEAEGSSTNFYLWHDGAIHWIGQTDAADGEFSFPHEWSMSPNGKFFGLATFSPLTEEDVPSPACPIDRTFNNAPEHCLDVYAYQAESGLLRCVSCQGEVGPEGEMEWKPGRGFSNLGGQENHEVGTGDDYPRSVLDDGTVFLDTPSLLSPRDSNGVGDVYAWRDGSYELISTGTSEQPSTFGDATADGSDVYFLTTQRLVKQDTDESIDLYDDRELGGLASQFPPGAPGACEGEGCKGTSPGAPAGLPEGSAVTTKSAAPACRTERKQAKQASRKASRLAKQARQSEKRGRANARRLRHQAAAARKRAHRIHQKAANCGGKG